MPLSMSIIDQDIHIRKSIVALNEKGITAPESETLSSAIIVIYHQKNMIMLHILYFSVMELQDRIQRSIYIPIQSI